MGRNFSTDARGKSNYLYVAVVVSGCLSVRWPLAASRLLSSSCAKRHTDDTANTSVRRLESIFVVRLTSFRPSPHVFLAVTPPQLNWPTVAMSGQINSPAVKRECSLMRVRNRIEISASQIEFEFAHTQVKHRESKSMLTHFALNHFGAHTRTLSSVAYRESQTKTAAQSLLMHNIITNPRLEMCACQVPPECAHYFMSTCHTRSHTHTHAHTLTHTHTHRMFALYFRYVLPLFLKHNISPQFAHF